MAQGRQNGHRKLSREPLVSFEYHEITDCKKTLPRSLGGTFSIAPFSSRLHTSCLRTCLFRGNVRDCTTTLKQGGLHLNWRVYPRFITPSSQREIPGITSHAFRDWYNGCNSLVDGWAGKWCATILCVGDGSALLWGGASCIALTEWGGKSSFCEDVCVFIEQPAKTQTLNVALENLARHSGSFGSWASGSLLPPHDTLTKTAWSVSKTVFRRGLLRCPWHLFPGPGCTFLLTFGTRLGASAAVAAAGLSSLLWGGWVAKDDLERKGGWNERLGMTWLMALACFWASANRSMIDSTASPKRLEGVIVRSKAPCGLSP